MVDLPQVPNLDPRAKAAPPASSASQSHAAPPAASRTTASAPAAVQDSVEEVLQASSEQALRLSHLEDVLNTIQQSVADLREEMLSGLVELRAVSERQKPRTGEGTREILSDRLDGVEAHASRAGQRTG